MPDNTISHLDNAINNLNNDTPSTHDEPKNLIEAVSKIQRYYFYEKENKESIDSSFFTLEQVFNYMKIGFKAGFFESLFFVIVLPFLTTVYPSFKEFFFNEPYTDFEKFIFNGISYSSIILITIWLSSLARYYIGELTKRAISYLITGRMIAFVLKGVLVYIVLKFLYTYSLTHPDETYLLLLNLKEFIDFIIPNETTIVNEDFIYYYFNFIVPSYYKIGFETLVSMLVLGLVPYFVILLKGILLSYKTAKGQKNYEKY